MFLPLRTAFLDYARLQVLSPPCGRETERGGGAARTRQTSCRTLLGEGQDGGYHGRALAERPLTLSLSREGRGDP